MIHSDYYLSEISDEDFLINDTCPDIDISRTPSKDEKSEMPAELYPPKRRPMNDDPNDDFVAIDFETMTAKRTSACALGMVRVIDGVIAQRFYSLINPIRDPKTEDEPNFHIHGISLAEAEKAPDFSEVFPMIKDFIRGLRIVCHNRAADITAMKAAMQYYGLSGLDIDNNVCTYQMTGESLEKCCKKYGIKLPAHHDALCDAEACAKIYLELIGKPLIDYSIGSYKELHASKEAKHIDAESRVRLEDDEISDKSTPFYQSTVVITGSFDAYPERNDIAKKIQKLGAKVTSSISKKTSIVVVGEGAGPKKLEKIHELRSLGIDIRMMYEEELVSIIGL